MNRESSWNVYEFSVFTLNDWIKNELLLENEESTEIGSDSHEKKITVKLIKKNLFIIRFKDNIDIKLNFP